MKKASTAILTLLFLSGCLTRPLQKAPTPAPDTAMPPAITDRRIFINGLTPSQQGILNELPGASIYDLEISIANNLYAYHGKETVLYTNTESTPLREIQVRLFPNILNGKMTIGSVTINGAPVTPVYGLQNSLMTLPLSAPLQPGESVLIKMDFEAEVSQELESNYGVQAYYDGVLALAHAYPMIAVYDDEGWNAEIPPAAGDVIYADMAFFTVTVDAPMRVTLAASGVESSRQDNGNRQRVVYEAGPVRDFYLAAGEQYQIFTKESGGITFRFYANQEQRAGAEQALEYAVAAVKIFSERYAPYPYTELDFVSTPTLALGIEYPGAIAITEWILEPDNEYLESTVAHEVGHQWFYNLVGNDQLDAPWLDESLTQFITMQYYADVYGADGADAFRKGLEQRWKRVQNREIPIGLPVREYSDLEYSAIVYGRGPLFFAALRDEMGTEAFDEFIKKYARENAFKIATPEILMAGAQAACNCDLTPLFEAWVFQ